MLHRLRSQLKTHWQRFQWYWPPQPLPPAPPRASRPRQCSTFDPTSPPSQWPSVLLLTPVKNAAQFLPQYLENLQKLTYPSHRLSVAWLESDSDDETFATLQAALPRLNTHFHRVALYQRHYALRIKGPRWSPRVQYARRAILAKSRNYLLSQALQDEDWVLWLDVDVTRYPPDIIETLLSSHEKIVVPHCVREGSDRTFDLNTFRFKPGARDRNWSVYTRHGIIQPPRGLGRHYLEDLQHHERIDVDGVGGTMLWVWADLFRDGLTFPATSYRGYIETEGLAAIAQDLGYTCWALPQLTIYHGDH